MAAAAAGATRTRSTWAWLQTLRKEWADGDDYGDDYGDDCGDDYGDCYVVYDVRQRAFAEMAHSSSHPAHSGLSTPVAHNAGTRDTLSPARSREGGATRCPSGRRSVRRQPRHPVRRIPDVSARAWRGKGWFA